MHTGSPLPLRLNICSWFLPVSVSWHGCLGLCIQKPVLAEHIGGYHLSHPLSPARAYFLLATILTSHTCHRLLVTTLSILLLICPRAGGITKFRGQNLIHVYDFLEQLIISKFFNHHIFILPSRYMFKKLLPSISIIIE